jgi:aminoglycoside phosphotransferase
MECLPAPSHRAMLLAMQAGPSSETGAVPASVRSIAAGRTITTAWCNEAGGITFEVGTGADRCFVKWTPTTSGVDLERERARLAWAIAFTPVPPVLDHGRDADGSWIVTGALAGSNAVSARWKADPARAVAAIGAGLRAFHDALPLVGCPFGWSLEERLADVRRRVALGAIRPERWHACHRHLDLERALAIAYDAPPIDQLVVCHGDTCAPNTLIGDDGRCTGHVDLGCAGIADRWADLAIATWSTQWNYGPGWEPALLAAYGIAPDDERTRYYRLLWDLDP